MVNSIIASPYTYLGIPAILIFTFSIAKVTLRRMRDCAYYSQQLLHPHEKWQAAATQKNLREYLVLFILLSVAMAAAAIWAPPFAIIMLMINLRVLIVMGSLVKPDETTNLWWTIAHYEHQIKPLRQEWAATIEQRPNADDINYWRVIREVINQIPGYEYAARNIAFAVGLKDIPNYSAA